MGLVTVFRETGLEIGETTCPPILQLNTGLWITLVETNILTLTSVSVELFPLIVHQGLMRGPVAIVTGPTVLPPQIFEGPLPWPPYVHGGDRWSEGTGKLPQEMDHGETTKVSRAVMCLKGSKRGSLSLF